MNKYLKIINKNNIIEIKNEKKNFNEKINNNKGLNLYKQMHGIVGEISKEID